MPREKRDRIEWFDELHEFLRQSRISAENVAHLETLTGHEDDQVAELAALILEIARVLPGKRNRWLKLARHHRPLFNRAVELFGVEFFEGLLAGYGDFESPLWHILEQYLSTPPWPCVYGLRDGFRTQPGQCPHYIARRCEMHLVQ